MIPVLVTCKDRLRYLDTTLKSLSATLPLGVDVYVSDDGSSDRRMIDYLTTNNRLAIQDYDFPNEDPRWLQYVGFIPNLTEVQGVADKVHVILRREACGIKSFSYVIKRIFEERDCAHVIKIQDDVVLKEGWYAEMVRVLTNYRCSLVSGFRYFFNRPQLERLDAGVEVLTQGNVGGLLMAISREACNQNRVLLDNNNYKRRDMDDFWTENCRRTGLPILIVNPGICQHIGFESLIYRNTDKRVMLNEVKNRLDMEMRPPYPLADTVATLATDARLIVLGKML